MEPIHVTHPMAIAIVTKASVDRSVKNRVACVVKRDLTMMILAKPAKVSIAFKFKVSNLESLVIQIFLYL